MVTHWANRFYRACDKDRIARLNALRKLRNGRPQVEIARKLNVSYQAYQKLENPRRCNPTI